MVANKLRYQWVLTFKDGLHGAEGRVRCMRRVARFAEKLRDKYGRLPYLYSPELHPDGHGWHVNFYVGRRLPHEDIQPAWGHGIVWVSDFTQHHIVKAMRLPLVEAVRVAANYACKYAAKDWSAEMLAGGARRYCTAIHCKPKRHVTPTMTLARAVKVVKKEFNGAPAAGEWASSESKTWTGPPVFCFWWPRAASDYFDG